MIMAVEQPGIGCASRNAGVIHWAGARSAPTTRHTSDIDFQRAGGAGAEEDDGLDPHGSGNDR